MKMALALHIISLFKVLCYVLIHIIDYYSSAVCEMSFVLVEFSEDDGGGVAVVAQTWLTPRKKEVFWPPVKEQKRYNEELKALDNADCNTWKLYKINRCFYETDDFEKAHEKSKLSQETSDLASDCEVAANKRRRIKNRRFSSSDEEDSDLRRPPAIKIKRVIVNEEQSESHLTFNGRQPTATSSKLASTQNIANGSTAETDSVLNSTAFQRKLLSKLFYIEEQNNQILSILNSKISASEERSNIDLPVDLPIKSLEDFQILDDFLKIEANTTKLINHISLFGEKDISSQVYRILKHLLTDEIASLYNYYGKRSEKKSLSILKLNSYIIEAVQKQNKTATEQEIEECIKSWLKHAPERKRNRDISNTINGREDYYNT